MKAFKWVKVRAHGFRTGAIMQADDRERLGVEYSPGKITEAKVGGCLVFESFARAVEWGILNLCARVNPGTVLWERGYELWLVEATCETTLPAAPAFGSYRRIIKAWEDKETKYGSGDWPESTRAFKYVTLKQRVPEEWYMTEEEFEVRDEMERRY